MKNTYLNKWKAALSMKVNKGEHMFCGKARDKKRPIQETKIQNKLEYYYVAKET